MKNNLTKIHRPAAVELLKDGQPLQPIDLQTLYIYISALEDANVKLQYQLGKKAVAA